jgi:hypothetical protein
LRKIIHYKVVFSVDHLGLIDVNFIDLGILLLSIILIRVNGEAGLVKDEGLVLIADLDFICVFNIVELERHDLESDNSNGLVV